MIDRSVIAGDERVPLHIQKICNSYCNFFQLYNFFILCSIINNSVQKTVHKISFYEYYELILIFIHDKKLTLSL